MNRGKIQENSIVVLQVNLAKGRTVLVALWQRAGNISLGALEVLAQKCMVTFKHFFACIRWRNSYLRGNEWLKENKVKGYRHQNSCVNCVLNFTRDTSDRTAYQLDASALEYHR